MKILVTGFEPFDGETVNPSVEAVRQLPVVIDGCFILKLELPVDFGKSIADTVRAIEAQNPDAIVCVGQAGGRIAITPEFVALNYIDRSKHEIGGGKGSVTSDGPAAYFSTLPNEEIVDAVRAAGIPAELSFSAGTYVCNGLLYGVLHYLKFRASDTLAGFIHVPYLPVQAAAKSTATPSLSLTDITKGLEASLRAIVAQLKH